MRWMTLGLLIMLVATCGQKGPLYLPEDSGNPGACATYLRTGL